MRDYDPTTGRYLQADPLGLVDGPGVYGYALQNPGRYVDPTGEFVPLLAAAAAAGAAGGVALGAAFDYFLGDSCYTWEEMAWDAGLGAIFGGLARPFLRGAEFAIRGVRVAPFGNKWFFPGPGGKQSPKTWNASNGKWPHYHRSKPGYGQGKGRHRPWDKGPADKSFWDRF